MNFEKYKLSSINWKSQLYWSQLYDCIYLMFIRYFQSSFVQESTLYLANCPWNYFTLLLTHLSSPKPILRPHSTPPTVFMMHNVVQRVQFCRLFCIWATFFDSGSCTAALTELWFYFEWHFKRISSLHQKAGLFAILGRFPTVRSF